VIDCVGLAKDESAKERRISTENYIGRQRFNKKSAGRADAFGRDFV
jgi:hypothetical protein